MNQIAIKPASFPWFDYSRYTFSLGLEVGDTVLLSGQSASEYDAARRGIVVRGGMARQSRTAYEKVDTILRGAGRELSDVVRVVEYVTAAGMDEYGEVEAVRAEVFGSHRPAINTVVVNLLLRPSAMIEIEVVAGAPGGTVAHGSDGRPGRVPARSAEGIVYLSSVLPVDEQGKLVGEGDVVAQTRQVYENASRVLASAGLGWSRVAKTVDYLVPDGLKDYGATGRVRRDYLGPVYPGATGVLMPRVSVPGALIQVDFMGSFEETVAVNPGWERYGKLTYSPAVRAGNVLFMSGQAAMDTETQRAVHAGDIAAQADYTYSNLIRLLEAAGGGPENLVKTIEYVTPQGLERYREVATVRAALLQEPWPASTGCVCKALLRPEFQIELDCMAILDP